MKSAIENLIAGLLSIVGLKESPKVTRISTDHLGQEKKLVPDEKDKYNWIRNMNIRTVIDVGAHNGESALQFHDLFPHAMIYSFEPLRDCFFKLNETMKAVPDFKSFNLALGDQKCRLAMHRSEFSQSSSLLSMTELHKEAFPFTAGEMTEYVDVDTLDNVVGGLNLQDNILFKIDVQGYEHKVIMGSTSILDRIKIIIVETSFRELYEGQPLFSDIYHLLDKHGFVYTGSWVEIRSPLDGLPLQQDSIFIRR